MGANTGSGSLGDRFHEIFPLSSVGTTICLPAVDLALVIVPCAGVRIKGKIYEVLWKGDSDTMKTHVTHLRKMIREADSAAPASVMMLEERIEELEKGIAIEDVRRKIEG